MAGEVAAAGSVMMNIGREAGINVPAAGSVMLNIGREAGIDVPAAGSVMMNITEFVPPSGGGGSIIFVGRFGNWAGL